MTNQVAVRSEQRPSLIAAMAGKYDLDPGIFQSTIKATCFPKGSAVSNEQFAAFLMVAKEYNLNPITKEIFAFPNNGGITPIVSVDGWMNLINSHPQMDGIQTEEIWKDDKLFAVRCTIHRKDRSHPTVVTEYMAECYRPTEPWKKWPARMLNHKAKIQCARVAFGFAGIVEEDEFERMKDVTPPVSSRVEASIDAEIKQAEPHDVHTGEVIEAQAVEATYDIRDPQGEVYLFGLNRMDALEAIYTQLENAQGDVLENFCRHNAAAIEELKIKTHQAE
jgi:phage recombination protein Bet